MMDEDLVSALTGDNVLYKPPKPSSGSFIIHSS